MTEHPLCVQRRNAPRDDDLDDEAFHDSMPAWAALVALVLVGVSCIVSVGALAAAVWWAVWGLA